MPDLTWHVAHCKARSEWFATRELVRRGFTVVYPHRHGTVTHARRQIGIIRALLPRYLFMGCHPDQGTYAASKAPGVATLLYGDNRLLEVTPAEIAPWTGLPLVDGCYTGCFGYDQVGQAPRDRWEPGTELEVIDGPLAGQIATVYVDRGRLVRVWLTLFAVKVEAELEPKALAELHQSGGASFTPAQSRRVFS